jgi:hypothetical protein
MGYTDKFKVIRFKNSFAGKKSVLPDNRNFAGYQIILHVGKVI